MLQIQPPFCLYIFLWKRIFIIFFRYKQGKAIWGNKVVAERWFWTGWEAPMQRAPTLTQRRNCFWESEGEEGGAFMIYFLIRLISHGARLKRGYNDQMRNQSYSYCDSPEKRGGEIKRENIYGWGVGKVPTDSSYSGYLQSSDTETRQFSDTIFYTSQISDRVHRIGWDILHNV